VVVIIAFGRELQVAVVEVMFLLIVIPQFIIVIEQNFAPDAEPGLMDVFAVVRPSLAIIMFVTIIAISVMDFSVIPVLPIGFFRRKVSVGTPTGEHFSFRDCWLRF
jgi:hypothetical protein